MIQEWLGRKEGKMTERYTRPTRQGMQGMAKIFDAAAREAQRTASRTPEPASERFGPVIHGLRYPV
jgi:hypothetical protein